jgi:hypothetical protein
MVCVPNSSCSLLVALFVFLFAGVLGIVPAEVVSLVPFWVVLVMVVTVLVEVVPDLEVSLAVLALMGGKVEVVAVVVLVAVVVAEVPVAEVTVSAAVVIALSLPAEELDLVHPQVALFVHAAANVLIVSAEMKVVMLVANGSFQMAQVIEVYMSDGLAGRLVQTGLVVLGCALGVVVVVELFEPAL